MEKSNSIATAGMILGIISIVFMAMPLMTSLVTMTSILSIIFGGVGLSRAAKRQGVGKGNAWAGLILGIISFILNYVIAAAYGVATAGAILL